MATFQRPSGAKTDAHAAIVSSTSLVGSVAVVSMLGRPNVLYLSGWIEFDPPRPCNLAFDVIVESQDNSQRVGTITVRPGAYRLDHDVRLEDIKGALPEKIDILLRASLDAARDTPDMFEIWGGSLRFKDLIVRRSESSNRPRVPAVLDEE